MTRRSKLWFVCAIAAPPLSIVAGYWWHSRFEPEYVARCRLIAPAEGEGAAADRPRPDTEEIIRSPEVAVGAAGLLRDRGVALRLRSTLDSEVDELAARFDVTVERRNAGDEAELSFVTPDVENSIPILTALADAALQALNNAWPHGDDPLVGQREQEQDRLAKTVADQLARVTELESQLATFREQDSGPTAGAQGPGLSAELNDARQGRLEAEVWLAEVRRKVRSGVSVEEIVAQLPRGTGWDRTRELLGTTHLQEELRRQQSAIQAVASVYGRNHPRMKALRAQVDELQAKLAAAQTRESADAALAPPETQSKGPLPATELLLKVVEDKWREALAAEQQLEAKSSARAANAARCRELDERLSVARTELHSVESAQERVRRNVAAAVRDAARRRPHLVEPPTLAAEPIVPSLFKFVFWSFCVGAGLSAASWRRFCRTSAAAGRAAPAAVHQTTTIRGSFPSREEENLARLKRLKPAA